MNEQGMNRPKEMHNIMAGALEVLPDPVKLGSRHAPLHHNVVRQVVRGALGKEGLYQEEAYRISRDQTRAEMRFRVPTLDNALCKYEVRVLNANDQRFALQISAAKVVLICANGMTMRVEDSVFNRKHTLRAKDDLREALPLMLEKFADTFEKEDKRVELAQDLGFGETDRNDLLVRCVQNGVIPVTGVTKFLYEYEQPRFPEWGEKNTLWFFENVITFILKDKQESNPFDWQSQSLALSLLLVNAMTRRGIPARDITYLRYGVE